MDITYGLAGPIPALFAKSYVDRFDGKSPEPRQTLRKVAIAGGLSTIPVIVVQLTLSSMTKFSGVEEALFTSYVKAGFFEELAKALCLLIVVWRRPEFDERFDGIVYA